MTPDEEVFYLVGLLSSALPVSEGKESLEKIERRNRRIVEMCERGKLGVKQYLAHYSKREEWERHFGRRRWQVMLRRKSQYDPSALLAPGHRIFQNPIPSISTQ